MVDGFFCQLYEEIDDQIQYTGIYFESADLGREVPTTGDTIIAPLRKADFEPRNPKVHFAYDVLRRYFLPDVTKSQANIVTLIVKRRELTGAEQALFFPPKG